MAHSFDDYWYRLIAANPALADYGAKMTLRVEVFRAELRKALEAGRGQDGEALEMLEKIMGKR